MPGGLPRAGGPHDGAEHVELQLRVLCAELPEPVRPGNYFLLGVIMLAGAHQAAVQQGIRGYDRGLRALGICLQPLPEPLRLPQIIPAPQDLIRRHHHLIAQLLCHLRRLLIGNGPVVMGNINNPRHHRLLPVPRLCLWRRQQAQAAGQHGYGCLTLNEHLHPYPYPCLAAPHAIPLLPCPIRADLSQTRCRLPSVSRP